MVIFKKGDIAKIRADAIVNAANAELEHGGGVALAIARAAGKELEKESRAIGFCPLGEFAVTSAGNLPARKVIHIPTIIWGTRERISFPEMENAWRQSLEYCREKGFRSVAVPLLGAGVAGFDAEKVKKMLARVAEDFGDLDIIIVEK